jgi:hypothetical protein
VWLVQSSIESSKYEVYPLAVPPSEFPKNHLARMLPVFCATVIVEPTCAKLLLGSYRASLAVPPTSSNRSE